LIKLTQPLPTASKTKINKANRCAFRLSYKVSVKLTTDKTNSWSYPHFEGLVAQQKYGILTIPFFATFSVSNPISGRKLATYYACIKYVPNTVLNFGIFY
jgi:hypothetical protein